MLEQLEKKDLNLAPILILTARADIGGGPHHVYLLLQALRTFYPSIPVFVSSPPTGKFYQDYLKLSEGYCPIPHRSFNPWSLFCLIRFCTRHNIKLIHTHGRGAGLYGRILKFLGFSVIHTFHGIHMDSSFFGRLKFKLDFWLRGLINYYVCVSESERIVALGHKLCTNENCTIIYNCIDQTDCEKIYQQFSEEECRDQFGLPRKRFIIGVLARNDFAKGIDLLLEHFSYYKKKNPPIIPLLVIAGGGYRKDFYHAYLEKLNLHDNVIFVGEVKEQLKFLKCLDVYVSNSRWEGMPLSVLEAMMMRVPCLLSNVPGHIDLIVDDRMGILFGVDHSEQFYRGLIQMTDKMVARKMAITAHDFAGRNFGVEKMVRSLVCLYLKFAHFRS